MTRHSLFFAAALALAPSFQAQASTVDLIVDGGWQLFNVDDTTAQSGGLEWIDSADGPLLTFNVTLAQPAFLQVVDGGFAGDQFQVSDNGVALGLASTPVNSYPASLAVDFDAAWADANWSRATYLWVPGAHAITGLLTLSVLVVGNVWLPSGGAIIPPGDLGRDQTAPGCW